MKRAPAPEHTRKVFDGVDHPVDALGRIRFRAQMRPDTIHVKRDDSGQAIGFVGTAIVFNTRAFIRTVVGGFYERIAPQAVSKTLAEADIRFLQNHNPDLLLARTNPAMRAAGTATLQLTPAERGLVTEADMAPTSYAQDLAILLDRGDINQMSFAFDVLSYETAQAEDGVTEYTVTELRLYDVSVVTYPAYVETDAGLRDAAFTALCRDNGLDPEEVVRGFADRGELPTVNATLQRTVPEPTLEEAKRARGVGPIGLASTSRIGQTTPSRALNGWTIDDLWPILDDAVVDMISTENFNAYWYCWLVDLSDEWLVYYDCSPQNETGLYQCTYEVDADGSVTLGAPVQVWQKTTYIPAPSDDDDTDANAAEDAPDAGDRQQRSASGSTSLPLSARTASWDAASAKKAVAKWASSDGSGDTDTINWTKYGQAFFWKASGASTIGDFKLPFADVVDGKLTAIWKGVTSAAGAIQGAQGGVDIPDADVAAVKARIASYYAKAKSQYDDDTIVPPWQQDQSNSVNPRARMATLAMEQRERQMRAEETASIH